jgi:nitroimidazol reductase NimA-like FMN-containing flavoprotein (pyridoxamine 5'-phosphate oxidase superfamily)
MRRKDKEITDPSHIEKILKEAQVCHVAMVDGSRPYIVPLSFGYAGDCLYFHSALQGRKIDILRSNPEVCFEFDVVGPLVESDIPCNWSVTYQSVIGFGRAEFLEDIDARREAFRIIMAHYSKEKFVFSDEQLKSVAMLKVRIAEISAKQSGF